MVHTLLVLIAERFERLYVMSTRESQDGERGILLYHCQHKLCTSKCSSCGDRVRNYCGLKPSGLKYNA